MDVIEHKQESEMKHCQLNCQIADVTEQNVIWCNKNNDLEPATIALHHGAEAAP